METDAYLHHLERILTPARLRHSLGVMQVMGALAEVYGLSREQAETAGLLHDAAKDFSPEQQEQASQAAGFAPQCEAERDYNLYGHGPVGAYYVRAALGVRDEQVLAAIHTHTFCGDASTDNGSCFHAPLCWCLRFSDVLEPNRSWDGKARAFREGAPELRAAAFAGRIEQAALLHTRMVLRFFDENDLPVHPNYPRALAELERGLRIGEGLALDHPDGLVSKGKGGAVTR